MEKKGNIYIYLINSNWTNVGIMFPKDLYINKAM